MNMAKEVSPEVVAIIDDDELGHDKPILELFKRLINNDNKQNTVLTNTQIVDILDKEFNINLWDIHELEGEIYLTIMKKYLKDWPQWDEFDKVINTIKNDEEALNKMLNDNYVHLKEYLSIMLDRAQAFAKNMVDNLMKRRMAKASAKDNENDNVVLEIQCSRNRLNQLMFRRPNPLLNNSIFNGAYAEPTQIKVNTLPLEAILNWWDVRISIQRGTVFLYERKTIHQLNHVLVNKNFMPNCKPPKVLPQDIQVSRANKVEKLVTHDIQQYVQYVNIVIMENPSLEPLLKFVQKDMRLMQDKIIPRSSYRRYTNKYPYTRNLSKDVKNPDLSSRKYNLKLEETISPMYRMYLGPAHLTNATVEVECCTCTLKFFGPNLIEELKMHFESKHADEPDWMCTNCGKIFTMAALSCVWWSHKC